MSKHEVELEKRKPDIVLRGKESILSVWVGERNIRLSISKKSQQGFERIDSFSIPVDYLLFKIFSNVRAIFKNYCEFLEQLEEEEEK